ncbi:MAG: DUF697 domain-containing protein [Candidatus Latescibacteria bacterium]|nr:DUF697 domain-containing protein [Candidatus Latescibacterota bacterium]
MKSYRYIVIAFSLVIIGLFTMFVINQTASVVELAGRLHPAFGTLILYALLIFYILVIAVPVIIILKMPKTLLPPKDIESPEYYKYRDKLRKRLCANKILKKIEVDPYSSDGIENAFKILDTETNDLLKSTASTVFITTAVSQNGRLDAIMVLFAQVRLVWKIAHIYNQRPSISEIMRLYAHVAATTFLVSTIEDLDIEQQVEPIITPLVSGSVIGGIPGASGVSTFMITSIIDGAANALLTLRVGIITRRFFGYLSGPESLETRRIATLEASGMLGSIVIKSAGIVTDAVLRASKKRIGTISSSIKDATVKSTGSVVDFSRQSVHKVIDSLKSKSKRGDDETQKSPEQEKPPQEA